MRLGRGDRVRAVVQLAGVEGPVAVVVHRRRAEHCAVAGGHRHGGARFADPGLSYALAKQVNVSQVAVAALRWGARGARVNAISPGVISTAMGRAELAGVSGEIMRIMVDGSATKRLGTPEDIAAAAEFLLGPQSSFVTGTNLLVDGGAVAGVRHPA